MEQQLALYAGLVATGALAPVLIYWPVWRKKERFIADLTARLNIMKARRNCLAFALEMAGEEAAQNGRDLVHALAENRRLRARLAPFIAKRPRDAKGHFLKVAA